MAAKTSHEDGDSMPNRVKYLRNGLVTCYAAGTVATSTIAEALLTKLQVWRLDLFSAVELCRMHGYCAYAWLLQLIP